MLRAGNERRLLDLSLEFGQTAKPEPLEIREGAGFGLGWASSNGDQCDTREERGLGCVVHGDMVGALLGGGEHGDSTETCITCEGFGEIRKLRAETEGRALMLTKMRNRRQEAMKARST